MVSTFLPVPDYRESCEMLDSKILGKQRSEIKIILAGLTGVRFKKWQGEYALELPATRGYQNHSASRMWRGYEYQLAVLGQINCEVWNERYSHPLEEGQKGYDTWVDMVDWQKWIVDNDGTTEMPFWFGREDIHSSHRSVLLSKKFDWYSQFGWSEEPVYKYVWPV